MPRPKDTVWMEWHSIGKGVFKEERVACNHCNFECVAQSNKLKAHLKKGTARLTPVFATLTPIFATLTSSGKPNQISKVFPVSRGTKSASLFEI